MSVATLQCQHKKSKNLQDCKKATHRVVFLMVKITFFQANLVSFYAVLLSSQIVSLVIFFELLIRLEVYQALSDQLDYPLQKSLSRHSLTSLLCQYQQALVKQLTTSQKSMKEQYLHNQQSLQLQAPTKDYLRMIFLQQQDKIELPTSTIKELRYKI